MSIEELVLAAVNLQYKMEEDSIKLSSLKSRIQKYFDDNNKDRVDVHSLSGKDCYSVSKQERVNITYDVDKLKKRLNKETFNEITDRKYIITDIDGIVKLLKRAKIKPEEFKQLIDVETTVNREALKQLYSIGEITMDKLKGCYDAKINKSIKIIVKQGYDNKKK